MESLSFKEFLNQEGKPPVLRFLTAEQQQKAVYPQDVQRMKTEQALVQIDKGTLQNPQIRMPVPVSNDPFQVEQYKNIQLPDLPIQYGGSVADSLLNDNEVPQEIKEKYWWVFHKDNVLTFLDEQRKASKLLNFDIIKTDVLNNIPYYDYVFDVELHFDILRNAFETKLDRAQGLKGETVKNERIVLQSQFMEQRQITESNPQGQIREGFFKRLLKRG